MNIEARFDDWKKKLLDLGKRNRLINFKLDSNSVLKFTKPSAIELYKTFVENEKDLEFPYIEDIEDKKNDEIEIQDYLYGNVYTNRKPSDAQKILRNLRRKYKTFIEEQDVNVLYLSFCFLEWSEVSYSKQTLISPLILVPVSIQYESIKSPIKLKFTEDEIVINPTLSYKLKNDYGVDLPDFQEEDFSIIYLKLKEFANINNWTIRDDVCLSVLSFSKINMYKDLEKNKESILNHAVVNALAGDQSLLEKITNVQDIYDIENFDHDSVKPTEIFNVLDADSSQQDAICCASKGISFVLQGPPGTGKSQTITNIIASKLAEGKKILFVSEKKAALDVVFKRLKDIGLSDFCLALHSNKANKREILSQLEIVLNLSKNRASISDSVKYDLDKLLHTRYQLNKYAREVNEIIEPLKKSIYFANGEISKYIDVDDTNFNIANIRETTEHQFIKYINILEEVCVHIKKMHDDCTSNPWYNTTIQSFSQRIIQEFGEHKDKLISGIKEFKLICNSFSEITRLNIVASLSEVKKLKDLLLIAKDSPIVPIEWIEDDCINELKKYIENGIKENQEYKNLMNTIIEATTNFKKLSGLCSFEINNITTSSVLNDIYITISDIFSSNVCFNELKKDISLLGFIAQNESLIREFIQIDKEIVSNYNEDIYSLDTKTIEMRFKYSYTSKMKIFNPKYWKDTKLFKKLSKNKKIKQTDDVILSLLNNISRRTLLRSTIKEQNHQMLSIFPFLYKEFETDFESIKLEIDKFIELNKISDSLTKMKIIFNNIEKKEKEIKKIIKERYMGINTDWKEISEAVLWIERFKSSVKVYDSNIKFSDFFVTYTCSDNAYKDKLTDIFDSLSSCINCYEDSFYWFAKKFENSNDILDLSFDNFEIKLNACASDLGGLENWIDYVDTREKIKEIGLGDYIKIIESKSIPSKKIIPIFKKNFYRLWIDSVLPEYPTVEQFRHTKHEILIKDFAELDKKQFKIAQQRIIASLINSLPNLSTFTGGEVNILKRELAKQRKLMPIRKLFAKIPDLLMKLKPCLMMSPLSVSQFLESECFQFDTVIFDEASQVKTENAIGAIFRGKQIIIAGDSHQLPPTNFFNVNTNVGDYDSDEDEENESLDTSILEEAMFLPNRELLWHYRSRHEHLIVFSNVKIYRNKLITFPSSVDKGEDIGVEYIYVENGTYNGKGVSRGNIIEAERVTEEVFSHIRKYPNRTLGVITFGIVQELAIESAINRYRKIHPEYEDFFLEDKPEAFFIKSLENVQGDERDTIIFSIGYAKDLSGKMSMRFGPLSMVGGERRLNVAVTRAKYNIKLIGSILPTDIDIDRVSQEGPKLLRKYIEFAMHGANVILNEIKESERLEFDSPFESSVFEFLQSRGYKVVTQVGCSGYKIDLAIKHPIYSGIYVLGIECDGATYHSSRTARERDRLRQDILELMGWKIYRIWSTDWIKNNISEKQRLLDAVEKAISSYKGDNFEFKTNNYEKKNKELESLINFEKKINNYDMNYGFKDYHIYEVTGRIPDHDVFQLSIFVKKIIENETPIHFELLCQRVCHILGRQKCTSVVQNMVNKAIIFYLKKDVLIKDDFVYLSTNSNSYNVRVAGSRQINHISVDELARGMLQILGFNIGLTTEELFSETTKSFGFNRQSNNITERLNLAIDLLKNSSSIEIKDGKIFVLNNLLQ